MGPLRRRRRVPGVGALHVVLEVEVRGRLAWARIGRRAKAASFKEVRDIARALSKKHHDAAAARELAAQLAAAREGQTWDEAVNAFTGFSESFKKDDCEV